MTTLAPDDVLSTPGTGDGPEVGLCHPDGTELAEAWYARKPWAFEVSWTKPLNADPHVTLLGAAMVIDRGQVDYLSLGVAAQLHSGDTIHVVLPLPDWMAGG